ncbi:hypothetical protein KPB2_5308 [Klebsiella pneumoniae Kb677]|nr:hypothetical protein KPB2_5308 [Klebsiella pneumoniae Kb677]
MLAFGGTVADFTAAVEADCPLQRMMSFAFVEPDLGTPLEFGIQNPVDHEQGALDATDFPQGCRELVLPRIGGEFPQNLAWRDGPGSNGGGDAQDVGPIALDHGLVDLSADQRSQVRRGGRRIERVEPFGWQVADARSEPVAENGTCGKDVIGEAARDRACASGTAKLAQPHVEASLPVCQPFLRPQWHSETTAFRDGLCRNECVFQIAIAPGPSKPDISGAERMALSQILQVNSMLTMGREVAAPDIAERADDFEYHCRKAEAPVEG